MEAPRTPIASPLGDEDPLLTFEEVVRLLYPASKGVRREQVYELIRRGTKVRGYPQRIRLRATACPHGLAVRLSDLEDYRARLQAAWESVHGKEAGGGDNRTRGAARTLVGGPRQAGRRAVAGMLRRCRPEEIGTYPPAAHSSGPQLRLVRGAGGRSAGAGLSSTRAR